MKTEFASGLKKGDDIKETEMESGPSQEGKYSRLGVAFIEIAHEEYNRLDYHPAT